MFSFIDELQLRNAEFIFKEDLKKTWNEEKAILLKNWIEPNFHQLTSTIWTTPSYKANSSFVTKLFEETTEYLPIEPCINCSKEIQRVR